MSKNVLAVALAASVLAVVPLARAEDDKAVLLIYAEARLFPAVITVDQGIRSTMQSRSTAPIHFYTEYLDLSWFERHEPHMSRLLKQKYAGRKIDLVIPCGDAAIRFVLRERAALAPDVPIVFCAAEHGAMRDTPLPSDVTGVTMFVDWAATLELALQLHPGTQQVAFVGGAGPTERAWEGFARQAFSKYESRVKLSYLTGLPMSELLKSVRALPVGTVVVLSAFLRDGAGQTFTGLEALSLIAGASTVPIYSFAETLLGHGIVGGRLIDFEAQGVTAAELGLRVLDGERLGPSDVVNHANLSMFDARQLARWGIKESRLPPGSVVQFRQPSTWQLYRWQITVAVVVTGLQALLIVGLVVERRQRNRARRRLAERLRFETLLSDLCAGFLKVRADEVDQQIEHSLGRIVEELGVDRATLGELVAAGSPIRVTHSSRRDGVPALPRVLETEGLPWITGRVRSSQVVRVTGLAELPDEAAADRRTLLALGTKSLTLVPFLIGGAVCGALAVSTFRHEREWSEELVERLRLMAEVFAIGIMRRHSEIAIEESENRFRVMADAAPVMMWMAGPDGRCTQFNRAWLEFTGRTLEQETGDGWLEGVHPDDQNACMQSYLAALGERRAFTIEYRLRRSDGLYRWVVDHGIPRVGRDKAFVGYIGSAVDMTEVKTAHQALVDSIALRSAIFGSLHGQVVALSRDGVILAVNESWSRFAQENGGDPLTTGVGANYLEVCRRAAAVGDGEAGRALDAMESVLDGRAQRVLLEYPCHSPSQARWFEMSVEPFKRLEGGLVISHVNVTRRWRAEEEAEHEREVLAHTLRVTTLGGLAGSLAHEINQPLAAIITNAQVIRRVLQSPTLDRGDISDALEDIAEDARRAAEVIRRLRALFKKDHSQREAMDVNEVIREITGLMRKDLERKRVALQLHLAQDLASVVGDPVQVQQVVLNLVVNACDAMALADGESRELSVATRRLDADMLEITVQDTGTGVEEADLERIFESFVTNKPGGLGMGLSISRSIIQAHRGDIWATRNKDRGLTLHIVLPCHDR